MEEGVPADMQHSHYNYDQIPLSEEPEIISVVQREIMAETNPEAQRVLADSVPMTGLGKPYQTSDTIVGTKSSSYPAVGSRCRLTEHQKDSRA